MPKNERLELLFLIMIIVEATETDNNPVKRLNIYDDDFYVYGKFWLAIKQQEMPNLMNMYSCLETREMDLIGMVNGNKSEQYNSLDDKLVELRELNIKRKLFLTGRDISDMQNIVVAKEEITKIEAMQEEPMETIEDILTEYTTKTANEQIITKFPKLNKKLFLQKGQLVTIGARPGIGKTSFVAQLAMDLASSGYKVLFFNIEMGKDELVDRMLSYFTGISNTVFKYRSAKDGELQSGLDKIYSLKDNLTIINKKRITSDQITTIATKEKPDVVLLDYIGLISDELKRGQLRTYQIGEWTRKFKILAGEQNLLFIQATQLNRDSTKENRRPTIADFRESGSIEQDSDIGLLLHRKKEEDPRTELIIAKNRHGQRGICDLLMTMETTSFREL